MAVHKKGQRWVADFYLGGRNGRRVRRSAPTRKLAEAVERDAKLRELRSELGADEIKHIGLKAFIKHYKDLYSTNKTAATRTRDRYIYKHILTIIGDLPLSRLSRENVERYMAKRAKSISQSTANRELDLLKSLLNRAVEWGYLKSSPAVGVKKLGRPRVFLDTPLTYSRV